ncbi:FAD-dependent oxidoreductase [Streptomyces sp. NPDC055709]
MLVVGGGPAGVAAATTATERGWSVVLAEARNCLGGQLALAGCALARRPLWHRWADWAESALRDSAVDVRTNTFITGRDCGDFERVVVATGARAGVPAVWTARNLVAVDAWAVMARPAPLTGAVLIVDLEGEWSALDCAEVLATHGLAVALVTAADATGHRLRPWEQEAYRERLGSLDVRILTRHELMTGAPLTAPVLRHIPSGLVQPIGPQVRAVVFASARESESRIRTQLQAGPEVVVVGDAAAPRALEEAIVEGTRAARMPLTLRADLSGDPSGRPSPVAIRASLKTARAVLAPASSVLVAGPLVDRGVSGRERFDAGPLMP